MRRDANDEDVIQLAKNGPAANGVRKVQPIASSSVVQQPQRVGGRQASRPQSAFDLRSIAGGGVGRASGSNSAAGLLSGDVDAGRRRPASAAALPQRRISGR